MIEKLYSSRSVVSFILNLLNIMVKHLKFDIGNAAEHPPPQSPESSGPPHVFVRAYVVETTLCLAVFGVKMSSSRRMGSRTR